MPFRNPDYSQTRNDFESPGSRNLSNNNFYSQKNFNGNFKNYNARSSYGSGQPQAPPQPRTCFKCGKLNHLANACRPMLGHSGPNDKQKSVLMSTLNRGQVSQTRTPFLQFTNNVICESLNSAATESDPAGAVFAAAEGAFSKGILAIERSLAGRHFDDIIIDTGSAVFLISTSLWDQLSEKFTRNQVKSKYIVANGTTLPVEGSAELPIHIGGLEITHRFIIVPTEVANILLGYDCLKLNKCDNDECKRTCSW